jgi:hypothetical protein
MALGAFWLWILLAMPWADACHKEATYKTPVAATQATIDTLFSPILHTFVLEGDDTVTLLVNKFYTIQWTEERYLQFTDCLWNQYSIHVYNGYHQVTRIDNKNDKVVWYNEAMSPEWWIPQRNTTEDEHDVEEPIPSEYELLQLVKSQGKITPFVNDDGEVVYKIVCL